jgi:hypothetical protein
MIKLMMKKCSKDGLVEIKNNRQKVLEDKKVFMEKEIDEDIDTIAHQDPMVVHMTVHQGRMIVHHMMKIHKKSEYTCI